jgi:hypothetical protein
LRTGSNAAKSGSRDSEKVRAAGRWRSVGRRSRAEPPGHDESLLDLTAIKKTSVDSATWRVLLVSAVPIIMTMASELRVIAFLPISSTRRRSAPSNPRRPCGFEASSCCIVVGNRHPLSRPGSKPVPSTSWRAAGLLAVSTCMRHSLPYPYGLMRPKTEVERLLEKRLGAQDVCGEWQDDERQYDCALDRTGLTLCWYCFPSHSQLLST